MKAMHKNKIVIGSLTFIKIKCDLYEVYDSQGLYCGITSDIRGTVII